MENLPILTGEKVVLRPITDADTDNIVRWRNTPSVRDNFIFRQTFTPEMHRNWLKTKVATGEVVQYIIEDKANGTAVIDVLKKEIPGIIPVEPFGGKVVRAHATTAVAEAGNVYIPAASACPWVMDFVEEMAAFPSGAHDDQVDCYSQANAYYNDNTFDIRSLIT